MSRNLRGAPSAPVGPPETDLPALMRQVPPLEIAVNDLYWVVRHEGAKQIRDEVRGLLKACRALLACTDPDAYVWDPGARAIDRAEAECIVRRAESDTRMLRIADAINSLPSYLRDEVLQRLKSL